MSKAVSHGDQLFVSGPPPLRRHQDPDTGRMEIYREVELETMSKCWIHITCSCTIEKS